jgi:hypothetical protein
MTCEEYGDYPLESLWWEPYEEILEDDCDLEDWDFLYEDYPDSEEDLSGM